MRRLAVSVLVALALIAVLPPAAGAASPNAGERAQQALQRVQDLFHGIGVRTGRELTPALLELHQRRGALDAAGRKTADSLLARPTSTEAAPGHAYTVPEATPFCTTHFCIHYVTTTVDAPDQTDANANGTPDYVEQMAQVFENEVFPCENGTAALGCADAGTTGLGWPQAPSDGVLGGDSRFDVYIEDLYPSNVFGYVSVDPTGQSSSTSLHSYLVMDKDFSRYSQTLTGADEMRVTAAHEYNHVLQFGIDANEDTWMFESTATFFENEVYPAIDDYLSYMPTWVGATADPLTDANGGGGLKMYGSAVWNHFIAGRHGVGTILAAWEAKTQVNGGSFAPASYDSAIQANGGSSFASEFDDFSTAVAEWRAPNQGFPDLYPDVPASARPGLTVGAAATSISLDHTTFAFRDVAVPASPATLTLNATLPSGLDGAISLVARTGNSTTAGTVTKVIQRTTNGGALSVDLPNADTYGRITAVFVNSDPTQSGFNNGQNDWNFTKDKESYTGIQVTSASGATPAPSATTTAASGIGQTSATLNGSVNPNGQATTYYFDYGTTVAYGSQSPANPATAGSGSGALAFSTAISGLTRGTTYHYRIVAQSGGGVTAGSDQTFTTLDPPVVTTGAASAIAADGATLNASVDPHGQATTFVFQYGPTVAYGSQIPVAPQSAGAGTGAVAVATALTGLAPGSTVHFRVVATNPDGTTNGADQSFKTLDPPDVTTGNAGAVTTTSALLTGTVNAHGKATTFVFEFGTSTVYGQQVAGSAGSANSPVSVSGQATGLSPGTTYHYRLAATNADGTTQGADQTFTTPAATAPTAGTGATTGTPTVTSTTTPDTTGTAPVDLNHGSAPTALTLALTTVRTKLASALKKGLRVRANCGVPCSVVVRLVLPAKIAKKLRVKATVATGKGRGGSFVTMRFTKTARKVLGRVSSIKLTAVVNATSADGRTASLKKALTIRR